MSYIEMIKYIISGIGITFKLVPTVLVTSLMLGSIIGIIQFKKIPIVSQILNLYIVVMRGIPPLVILMMLYFTVNMSSAFLTAYVALSLYHSAYIGEIVRGGFEAVPRGQMEAGRSLGVGYARIMVSIYIPQIVLQIVPSLCGQFIMLVKDTTLVSVVGLQDIMWNAKELIAVTYKPLSIYFLVGVLYFVVCFLIDLLARRMNASFIKRYAVR